jgi:hypothetical protein
MRCDTNEANENVYKILVVKSKGNRPPGRITRRWENNHKFGIEINRLRDRRVDEIRSEHSPLAATFEHTNTS